MDTKGAGSVVVLVVLGLFLGGMGVLPTYEHHVAVQEGQPTTGVVQETEIEVKVDDDGDRSYHPRIEYEYVVDGQTYTSDNTFPGRFTRWRGSRSWAEDVVAAYGVGQEVTVHYDPSDPSNAYVHNDGLPFSWFLGAGYVVLAVAGGVWMIRVGFRRWRQRTLVRDTPTETVRALSMGPSEVKGTAVTEDLEPLTAPFSGADCVVAKYEVEQYDDADDDEPGSWETVAEGVRHTPFYLDDGTGSVLVEPADEAVYDLDPGDWEETYVDSSERGPEPVQAFVRRQPGLGFPSHSGGRDNDRKYRQNLLRTGESAYVLGTVRPREGDVESGAPQEDRLSVRVGPVEGGLDEDTSILSDDTEANLIERRRWALWRAPVGAAFLVLALCFTIAMFGPMAGLELPVLL